MHANNTIYERVLVNLCLEEHGLVAVMVLSSDDEEINDVLRILAMEVLQFNDISFFKKVKRSGGAYYVRETI